ncbi:MAG TPA: DUF1573 domain-containing protein [Taishania sp.]|nr:DUF1573 domain-containing protein [Taishania sp.]
MKQLFLFSLLCILPLLVNGQAKFLAVNPTHEFQDTKEGELLTHYYTVKNIGNAPLIISDYKVACSCTKIELPSQPILPGSEVKLKMTFDTKGKYNWQDRTIVLTTNTKKKQEKLRFKVFVISAE